MQTRTYDAIKGIVGVDDQILMSENPSKTAVRALTYWRAIAAIGLLLLNDHVLKDLWPGWVTGKLSDFAGLVFFPLLLAVMVGLVVRRQAWAIRLSLLISGVWFCAIKTMAWAAAATESAAELFIEHSEIIVDPTDLLALPALALAAAVYRDALAGESVAQWMQPRTTQYLRVGVLAAASITTVATSCIDLDGVTHVIVADGAIYAFGDTTAGSISRDGGATWERDYDIPGSESPFGPRQNTEGCLPNDPSRCFRVNGEPLVEESNDGGSTWQIAWEPPAGRPFFQERFEGGGCSEFVIGGVDLLVSDTGTVLVGMGDLGLVRRNPDGTWDRDVTGYANPETGFGYGVWAEMMVAVAAAILVLLLGYRVSVALLWGSADDRPVISGAAALGLLALAGSAVLAIIGAVALGPSGAVSGLLVVPAVPLLLLGLAGLAGAWATQIEARPQARPMAVASSIGSVLTGLAVIAPFLAWSAGGISRWEVALMVAIVAGVGAAVVTIQVLRRVAPSD